MTKEIERIAYTLSEFAEATGFGVTSIREAIAAGDLVPSYHKSKPVIEKDEGTRWVKSLPAERVA